uniref:Uncharacterized protein n=1 Tax=Onchocerca volvulus TaxID=6282 RepID=A0A8R1U2M6_ONCVO
MQDRKDSDDVTFLKFQFSTLTNLSMRLIKRGDLLLFSLYSAYIMESAFKPPLSKND